ncbi:TetR/AcrR family transcriptional regulator [Amycolatopsis ultiminotia]|uniref:TetR/AcrR family transcriptional regulator n=1 Tax=Amycolatopsis ultiminotia TaxID=543629 RepID=A0ABP6XG42_9PSEU
MADHVPVPARGTRPRNRRELILAAAVDLFTKHGYHQVAMSDLAAAVGIGPSALYRHFSGKEDVLANAVEYGLRPALDLVGTLAGADPDETAGALAALTLDRRYLGLLWQREARDLGTGAHRRLREMIRELGAGLANHARSVRPGLDGRAADLLAWSVLSVLASPSFHHLDLPRPEHERLIAELVTTVLETEIRLPPAVPAGEPRPPLVPASRREELLGRAIPMFAAHGYAKVGIEDIGNAAGITGPSVYNHWPTKLDLLVTALQRGAAGLAMDVSTSYRVATGAADALRRLVTSYVAHSHTHPEIFGLLITEMDHLPEDELHLARRAQHDYVSEWTHLLRLTRPALDPVAARIRVHAALSVAHDTARTPHLRLDPGIAVAVETLCGRLLTLPPG